MLDQARLPGGLGVDPSVPMGPGPQDSRPMGGQQNPKHVAFAIDNQDYGTQAAPPVNNMPGNFGPAVQPPSNINRFDGSSFKPIETPANFFPSIVDPSSQSRFGPPMNVPPLPLFTPKDAGFQPPPQSNQNSYNAMMGYMNDPRYVPMQPNQRIPQAQDQSSFLASKMMSEKKYSTEERMIIKKVLANLVNYLDEDCKTPNDIFGIYDLQKKNAILVRDME